MSPPNSNTPIAFNDPLPQAADVVIIGAGVIGITAAWYLRESGLSVLVCEKGRVAGEQSSRNWGWIRVTGRDPDEVPIAMDSIKRWEQLSKQLDDDIGFHRGGVLALASSEKEMADFREWQTFAKTHELITDVFNQKQIKQHIDVPVDGWHGGMITPSDARAEPFVAVPAMARGLQKMGGQIREACAVRTIETEAGIVSAVVTEHGTIKTSKVLCAAGAWSSLFLSNLSIRFPQLTVRATVTRTAAAPDIFNGACALNDLCLRRRQDGGYTVTTGFVEHAIGPDSFRFINQFRHSLSSASDMGVAFSKTSTQQSLFKKSWHDNEITPFEKHRILNPMPTTRALNRINKQLRLKAPKLAEIPIVESWAGVIDATPDVVPVMDQIDTIPGLFLATGFSGHGFGIGPGAGKVMAQLITGETPPFDLNRFRFNRFSDGSKIRPGPAI